MTASSFAGSMGTPARSDTCALARRLVLPGIGTGLLAGLLYIVVMGPSGMGYASSLNLAIWGCRRSGL